MSDIKEKLSRLNRKPKQNAQNNTPSDILVSPLQSFSMAGSSIGDGDRTDFSIENRTIQSFIPLTDIVVQNDTNSKTLSFVVNRYFDNVDLSEKNIRINYINAYGQSGSDIGNVDVIDDTSFTFLWKIDSGLTSKSGKIEFGIEFYEENAEEEKIYIWQTKPSHFNVEQSIIVLNNSVLNDYSKEKTFYDENSSAEYISEIKDSDSPIQISNRTISTGSLKDVVVEKDNVSQIISFKINRYFDGVDLATKLISIKYTNAAGKSDRTHAVNVTLSQLEIEFGWVVDSRFTEKDGIGKIAIEFLGYDENDNFYVWQTKPADFPIEKGLSVDNSLPVSDPNWIQSLNLSIVKLQTGKADLIDGKVPLYQLPDSGPSDVDLSEIENRILNLENDIDLKSETILEDSYLLFPNMGNENNIYVDTGGNKTYRWDGKNLKYYIIGSDYTDIKIINGGSASG